MTTRLPTELQTDAAARIEEIRTGHIQPLESGRVMIVDDEPINCKVAKKHLALAGFSDFVTVTQPTEAIGLIQREQPDVILLDIMMPEISGLEILGQMRSDPKTSHLPVLILTASCDQETRRLALENGATDFLQKPVDPTELIPRVRNAMVLKQHHDHITDYARMLEHRVHERTAQLTVTQMEVVYCLGRAAEYRDTDTGNHVVRVGRYAGIIAKQLGTDRAFIELIEHAAPLHDVGKIAIPDEILLKPGKLSPEEFEFMSRHAVLGRSVLEPFAERQAKMFHTHTELGAQIIGDTDSPILQMACRIALTHHEKWDGSGYPLGLAGEDIPIEGRITAAADVYDALSSKRPYKPAFPREKCFDILRKDSGSHFDPAVIEAFMGATEEIIEAQIAFADG